MPRFVLIGLCEPKNVENQAAFDEWFIEQHIEDTAHCPNMVRGSVHDVLRRQMRTKEYRDKFLPGIARLRRSFHILVAPCNPESPPVVEKRPRELEVIRHLVKSITDYPVVPPVYKKMRVSVGLFVLLTSHINCLFSAE